MIDGVQVLLALLKFDSVYVLEYFLQIIFMSARPIQHQFEDISRWMIPLSSTMIPLCLIIFFTTAYCVRHEHTLRTFLLMVRFICHLSSS